MSGRDEVITVPICPKCHRIVIYDIFMRERSRHGTQDVLYGTIGHRESKSGDVGTSLIIGRGRTRSMGEDVYIQHLKNSKRLGVYGFRCEYCRYLFTKRRMKMLYQELLDIIFICLRRNKVSITTRINRLRF